MQSIVHYLSQGSILLLIINLIFLQKAAKATPPATVIKWFLLVSLLIQFISSILSDNKINNLFLLHIYTLLEFLLLSLFYQQRLTTDPRVHRYYLGGIILVSLLIIANSLWIEPLTTFNENAKTLTHVFILAQAVSYFFFHTETHRQRLTPLYNFFNAGVVLYYAGSFFIFMFSDFLVQQSVSTHRMFLVINALLYALFQTFILVGLWRTLLHRRKSI